MRLIGDQGAVVLDAVRHHRAPARLETSTQMSLDARELRAVRLSPLLSRPAGVEGRPSAGRSR